MESSRPETSTAVPNARTYERPEHPVSRKDFAREVIWVLQRLKFNGHKAFLVGGAVRDLYLGREPKDYDVATDARPARLKKLFRNCRIIGRRFRIAHVFFPSGRIIEVATFRRNSPNNLRGDSGIILRDNEFGNPVEDAQRRDLTINALFYDFATFSVLDYIGGVDDLKRGVIRMINDPEQSFREDPVRMMRALRHAARLDFHIEDETRRAIYEMAGDILEANPSRLLEEFFKDLRGGASRKYFEALLETGLLEALLPELADQFQEFGEEHPLWGRLEVLDQRCAAGQTYSNSVLLSAFLHTLLFPEPDDWECDDPPPPNAWNLISSAFRDIPRSIRISRRDTERVAQILIAHRKLRQQLERGKLPRMLASKNYIEEALDFLSIDQEARGLPLDHVEEWSAQAKERRADSRSAGGTDGPSGSDAPRKRRRRRRRRPNPDGPSGGSNSGDSKNSGD
ncbi:MAG: polynucleotide adenylyltransferase PcnB [Planctomycetota bacterium]